MPLRDCTLYRAPSAEIVVIFDFLSFRCSYGFHFFFLSYFLFVFVLFFIGHEAYVLYASFVPPLCDEVIFLWLTVEGIDSWMNDNHHKQQKLIHKIPLSPNLNLFCEIYFRD